jgi:YidC/Oxa1 family membrane protein insertase
MDKKSLIGLLLMGVLLIGYSIITKPSKEEIEQLNRERDSIARVEIQNQIEAQRLRAVQDTLALQPAAPTEEEIQQQRVNELGNFAEAANGQEEFLYLENQKVRLKISTKGGRPYSAELKEYETFDKKPLILFDGETSRFNLNFFAQNRNIATQDLYFIPQTESRLLNAESQAQSVVLRLQAGPGSYMDYMYTLEPDSYQVGFTIRMEGMDQLIGKNTTMIDLDWSQDLIQQEKGWKFESQYSGIFYKFFEDEVGKLQGRKVVDKDLTTKVEWIAFKQQFFSTVFMAGNYMSSARISTSDQTENSGLLKTCKTEISIPFENKSIQEIPFSFYFVPNHYKTLKAEGHELTSLVDLGWPFIAWINKWFVVNLFHILEGGIDNHGIIIIILTIFFKLLVLPLSYKSSISAAKMKVLKPQVEELSKKFPKEKAMEKQQATMALYKKAGVNPMGGCLPALIQMPIWIALFRFFPSSIELRQEGFLWIKDLSAYDSILNLPFTIPAYGSHISLMTLLMALSMVVTTKMSMDQTATAQPMPGMKLMMYLMPVMMLVMFNAYASGLTLYYFFSNVISYLQQIVIRRTINEEKLLRKLTENQKKPGNAKKSKFQERLELMQKQQQSMQKRR